MSNARKLADNLPSEGSLSGRNVVINGAMNVAQRATSASGVGTNAGAYHTLDRWKLYTNNTAGRLTMSQASDAPSGFTNSLKFDCTTADTSAAADEALILITRFEGQDLQRFCKGTSDAKEFTISFYVKGNANATYGCELYDQDNSRQITKQFSVTTAWTKVVITFPADTTGAFVDDSNLSLSINFWLHAGSNHNGGTLNSTSWAANVNANRVSSSQTSFFDSTNREFYLTGVQLEVGPQSTPFEHRSFGDEMSRCQRYFTRLGGTNTFDLVALGGMGTSSTVAQVGCVFPTRMRATPAVAMTDLALADSVNSQVTVNSVAISSSVANDQMAWMNFNTSGSITAHRPYYVRVNNNSTTGGLKFDAEL